MSASASALASALASVLVSALVSASALVSVLVSVLVSASEWAPASVVAEEVEADAHPAAVVASAVGRHPPIHRSDSRDSGHFPAASVPKTLRRDESLPG